LKIFKKTIIDNRLLVEFIAVAG